MDVRKSKQPNKEPQRLSPDKCTLGKVYRAAHIPFDLATLFLCTQEGLFGLYTGEKRPQQTEVVAVEAHVVATGDAP